MRSPAHPVPSLLRTVTAVATGAALALGVVATSPVHAEEQVERYVLSTTDEPAAEAVAERTDGEVAEVAEGSRRPATEVVAELTPSEAGRLEARPEITEVVRDVRIRLAPTQLSTSTRAATPPWGLDRIDQRGTAGDGRYRTPTTGAGTVVAVVDSGLRATHSEFSGRVVRGYDYVDGDRQPEDCDGHGTHVTGTAAGTTLGAAPGAEILPLRVFDCNGEGFLVDVLWAFQDLRDISRDIDAPMVVNFSGGVYVDQLDADARALVADTEAAIGALYGERIAVVTAAGNAATSSCRSSPGRLGGVINVAASDISDRRSSFSDFGGCVDVFAPGTGILSTWRTSDRATAVLSGTSMAAPHVTGVVARFLQRQPGASVGQVRAALFSDATLGAIRDAGTGSPNRLVYADVDFRTPGVPTSVSLTADHAGRSARVRWSPPTRDGGRPVTGYRVTRSDTDASGGGPVTTTVSAARGSHTFGDLEPGRRYTVSVTAINAVGTGTSRSWAAVTLLTPPSRPDTPILRSGYTTDRIVAVRADWDRPGGGTPDHYVLTARPTAGGSTTTAKILTSRTWGSVPGLVRGRTYIVSVYAVNAAGAGPKSRASSPATAR